MKVSVTVTDNAITEVVVTEHMESPGISDPAIERIPAAIVEHQSLNIDVVSGATLTCAAVLEGAEKALAAAGADIEALKNKEIEVEAGDPIDKTADVIVIGGGGAGLSASVAAAEAGASVIMIESMDVLGGNTIISGGKWNAADPDIQGRTETVSGQIDTLKTYLDKNPEDYFGKYANALVELQEEIKAYLAGDTSMMFDSVNLHIIQCYDGGLRQDLDGNWIYGDFDLVKTFCEQSLPTLHRIQQNWKMPFQDNVTTVYGGLWKRGHSPENESEKGAGYFLYGKQYAEELGVEIMFAPTGKSLIMDNGCVVGVNALKG